MAKSEKALALFSQGFNSSQSVLTAFSTEFNISENECMKIACAFGGGMGTRQLTCRKGVNDAVEIAEKILQHE